jgi:hypothetical protein
MQEFEDEIITVETPEERVQKQLESFGDFWRQCIYDYDISVGRGKQSDLDAKRIAYLCSKKITQIFHAPLGQDAGCEFWLWAKQRKLKCRNPVRECEFWANGSPKPASYPSAYNRLFPHLYFGRFIAKAEEITFPSRTPVFGRTPVNFCQISTETRPPAPGPIDPSSHPIRTRQRGS